MRQDTNVLNRELFQTCKVLPWGAGRSHLVRVINH